MGTPGVSEVNVMRRKSSFSKLRRQIDQAQGREKELNRKALLKRLSLELTTELQRSWTRDELYN